MTVPDVKRTREQVQAWLRARAKIADRVSYPLFALALLAKLIEDFPSVFGLPPGSQPTGLTPLALLPALVLSGLAQHWLSKADNLPEDLSLTEYA